MANKKSTKADAKAQPTTKPETAEHLNELMSEGRKALLVDNLLEAIDQLSDAAALSVKLHEVFAPETYEPHYLYGKALLELASAERELIETNFEKEEFSNDPILGDIKQGIKVLAELSKNQEDNKATPMETLSEEPEQKEKSEQQDPAAVVDGTGDKAEPQDEEMPEESSGEDDEEVNLDQTAEQNDDDDEEADQVENAQLAWEILDYARTTCVKNIGDNSLEWLERQKDTLILLGNCALNEDKFELAIQDLKTALEIVNKHFAEDLREIAFINMELARVNRKAKSFDLAIQHIDNSKTALEQYKEKTKDVDSSKDPKVLSPTQIDELLEEVADERAVTLVRQAEEKENAEQPKEPQKPDVGVVADQLVIKRKEKPAAVPAEESTDDGSIKKRPAEESNDEATSKKPKVDEAMATN